MGKRLPTTPRSRIKNALRMVWLRSRERAACLKAAGNRCERCGIKASQAKGREVKLQVHHRDGINWDGIVDSIISAMLPDPSRLEALCKPCHEAETAISKEHEQSVLTRMDIAHDLGEDEAGREWRKGRRV